MDNLELLREKVRQIMHLLDESEQDVLNMRYGLNNDVNHTLDEVGRHFNMSREQVRQIEKKALRQLSVQNRQ
jgi:RNA polymerase sigma factor (sigma-70 family)